MHWKGNVNAKKIDDVLHDDYNDYCNHYDIENLWQNPETKTPEQTPEQSPAQTPEQTPNNTPQTREEKLSDTRDFHLSFTHEWNSSETDDYNDYCNHYYIENL